MTFDDRSDLGGASLEAVRLARLGAIAAFILVVLAATVRAEPSDGRRLAPENDLVSYTVVADKNADVSTLETRLKLAAPLLQLPTGFLGVQAGYTMTRLSVTGGSSASLELHRFDLGLLGGAGLGNGLAVGGSVLVGNASDVHGYDAAAWDLTASVSVSWRPGRSDNFLLGAVAGSRTPSPVLPLVGWVHQAPHSGFRADLLFPRGINLSDEVTPATRVGIAAEIMGPAWAIAAPTGTQILQRTGGSVAATYQRRLVGSFYLDARAGVLYSKVETSGDDRMSVPYRPAAYARLGIVLNP